MCSRGYVWQSQRCNSYQKGVISWGRKRGSGPSTRPSGEVPAWLLLPKRVLKCQFLYVQKSFCEVGLSQLLCAHWLLARNIVLSQAGLCSLTRLWSRHLGMFIRGPSVLYPKQPLAARPPPYPTDHLIYSDGLSHLTSVWQDKRKLIAPFVNFGSWCLSQSMSLILHWQVQQGHRLQQPTPMFHHPYCKKFLPYIQSKSTLPWFKTITPCPVTTALAENIVPVFPIGPLQVLKGCNKVSLESSLPQAEQPQLSQPFLIGELLYASDCFCGPSLEMLQQVHVFRVLRAPDLDTVLQVGCLQSRGAESPSSTCWPLFFWCSPGYSWPSGLWAHTDSSYWASRQPTLPSPSPQGCSSSILHPACICAWDCPDSRADVALDLVELNKVCRGPPLKLVKVPLDAIPSLQHVYRITQ